MVDSDFCKAFKRKLNAQKLFKNKCTFKKNCLVVECDNTALQDTLPKHMVKVRKCNDQNKTAKTDAPKRCSLDVCTPAPGVRIHSLEISS